MIGIKGQMSLGLSSESEHREEAKEKSGKWSLELSLAYILIALTALITGLLLGLRGRPELLSYMIIGGIIAYLITLIVSSGVRWIPLMLTIGLHVGAIVSYYSNPIVLPLIVIERWGDKSVVNLDIIQLIIAYEIVILSISKLKQNLKPEKKGNL